MTTSGANRAAAEIDDGAAEQGVELASFDGRSGHCKILHVVLQRRALSGHHRSPRALPRGARSCSIGRVCRPLDRPAARLDAATVTSCSHTDGCTLRAAARREVSGAMFYNAEGSKPWRGAAPPSKTLVPLCRHEREPRHRVSLRDAGHGLHTRRRRNDAVRPPAICWSCRMAIRTRWATVTGSRRCRLHASGCALLKGELGRSCFGGGGETTSFVCGYLACEAGLIRPVLAGLPRVVRVNVRTDAAGQWLESSILHAVERVTAAAPGSDVILARLAEVLFTEALQRYLKPTAGGSHGLAAPAPATRPSAAASRPCIAGPAHPWTLDELAEETGGFAFGAHGTIRALPRPVADGLPRRLAHRARRRGSAHDQPQRAASRERRRLRIGGGVQSRLQAPVRPAAGAVSAQHPRTDAHCRPSHAPSRARRRPSS